MSTFNNTMKKYALQEFEVAIPSVDGESIAERIRVNVPVEWDEELQQYLLTPDAQKIIEDIKARYMGLLVPDQLIDLRQRLGGLSQKAIGDLLQIGEKSWTRWENGKQRPSRSVNLLLRALYEGELSVEYLQRAAKPAHTWARTVEHLGFEQSAERLFIQMDAVVSCQTQWEGDDDHSAPPPTQLLELQAA